MADPEPVPIPKDLDWWNRLRRQEQQNQPGVPPTPIPDPKSPEALASALSSTQTHYAQPPNPTLEMVDKLLGGAGAFASGGLHGLAKYGGVQTPEWSDQVSGVVHNPDLETALGTFAGIRDPALLKALKGAEASGATQQDLWNNYKSFRGLDTKFRQYIPDAGMTIPPGFKDQVPLGYPPLSHVSGVQLQHLISHPELFDQIPELKSISTEISKGKGQWGGGFASPEDHPGGLITARGSNEKELRDVLAHEIQHGAQDVGGLEGALAPGESKSALETTYMRDLLEKYKGKLDKVPAPLREDAASRAWRDYQGNIGEIEARLSGSLASTPASGVTLDHLRSILYNPVRMPTSRNVPWGWYQQQTPEVRDALRGSGVRALKASEN